MPPARLLVQVIYNLGSLYGLKILRKEKKPIIFA
jgi:hypothetical protein